MLADQVYEREECLVPGTMAVVVVQQAEVVDVEQCDTERHTAGPGMLEFLREKPDEDTVCERSRERVAAGRLQQGGLLPREAALGRAEDQKEQQRGDESGAQGD